MLEKQKPEVDPKVEGLKVKKKPGRPRKLVEQPETIKVDLSKKEEPKKEEDAVQVRKTEEVLMGETPKDSTKVDEQVRVESNKDVDKQEEKVENPIAEITEEKKVEKEIKKPEVDNSPKLPENVEKLVSFMNETGGNLEDYVRLNRDYSKVNDDSLLLEYYKQTKPHLEQDEINFLLEDKFYFDDETEDERAVKKKQLARKEEIAKAKHFLDEIKGKYYDEIKLRQSNGDPKMQKAVEFFNRYNKEQEQAKEASQVFVERTNEFFSPNDFKGFDFDLGDKRFRYGIADTQKTSNDQANINNFLRKFLGEDGTISNMGDYHKALYTANNADKVAKHFYEQGVADATKNIVAKSKNISTEPKSQDTGSVFVNGLKVRAITGADSSKLKIQRKLKNN